MVDSASTATSTDATLSCAIIAEDRLFRELLTVVLAIRAGVRVVAHADCGLAGTQAYRGHRPDLLVVVIPPLPEGAIDVTRHYLAAHPRGRVLAVTGPVDGFAPPHWLARRLVAVVDRNEPLQSVWSAIDGLVAAADRSLLRRRLGAQPLSPREADIFASIGEGLTTREISDRLGLSEHTVRTHRKRIAAKLGTEGADLTRWAILANHNGVAAEALK